MYIIISNIIITDTALHGDNHLRTTLISALQTVLTNLNYALIFEELFKEDKQ